MPEGTPQPEHEKEKVERLREAMYSRALSDKIHPRERRELEEAKSVVLDDWKRKEPEMAPVLVAPVGIGWVGFWVRQSSFSLVLQVFLHITLLSAEDHFRHRRKTSPSQFLARHKSLVVG
jgi:hypothetical protein